jgi:hypothetical protein
MIFSVKITIEELSKAGKGHKWKSCECPVCHKKMWGHGYVLRYFSESLCGIFLKRYRCQHCRCVATTRPEGYWPRVRSSVLTIYRSLKSRLSSLRWPVGFARQRGGHWLSRFTHLAQMELKPCLAQFLEFCFSKHLRFFGH